MFFNDLDEKSGRPGHFNDIMDADLSPFIVYTTSTVESRSAICTSYVFERSLSLKDKPMKTDFHLRIVHQFGFTVGIKMV